MNTGYVKVPVGAVRAIHGYAATAGSGEAFMLLLGYLKLRWHEYPGPPELRGPSRRFSCAGALAIGRVSGQSSAQAKKTLTTLLEPPAALSKQAFIVPTGRKRALAPVYELSRWDGPDAYLPALLWDKDGQGALKKIQNARVPARLQLDALYLLIELYARMDYDWLAAPPRRFAYQEVAFNGDCELGNDLYPLGRHGRRGEYDLWLAKVDDAWRVNEDVSEELFGPAGHNRLFEALELLLELGLISKVLVVEMDEFRYPLHVHLAATATSLQQRGIVTDLARRSQRAAEALGDEAARALAKSAAATPGTGLYYCVSDGPPSACLLLMPAVHAPTPENLSGLEEVATRTLKLHDILKQPTAADALNAPNESIKDQDGFDGLW